MLVSITAIIVPNMSVAGALLCGLQNKHVNEEVAARVEKTRLEMNVLMENQTAGLAPFSSGGVSE